MRTFIDFIKYKTNLAGSIKLKLNAPCVSRISDCNQYPGTERHVIRFVRFLDPFNNFVKNLIGKYKIKKKITTELEQTQLEIQQTYHERSTGQQIINTTELALNVISYLQLKLLVYFNLYKFLLTSQPFPKIVKENDSGQGCPVEKELNQIMARSVILTENSLRPNELYNDYLLRWQYFPKLYG